MAITNEDIVLFQSQDNTDNDNGGGLRTSVEVVDGAVNNLFPDISRIDTVSGDVALRKVFPVVNTQNRDIYFGAHAMIRKTPTDPNVSALLFYTDSPTDQRSEARDDIEAYLAPSFETPFYLFGTNIQGSRAITVLQRLTEQVPAVGDVYLIREGQQEQYIRVSDISPTEVTLSFDRVDYQRRRIVLTIEQPLNSDFTGSSFNPDGQTANTADMFTTQVADAAQFYGTRNLEEAGSTGDLTIVVDSIFEQLVPAATQQVPIINAEALQQGELLVPSAVGNISVSNGLRDQVITLPTPVTPGTFTLASVLDDGNGNILNSSGTVVGSINYITGTYRQDSVAGGTVQYRPATVIDSDIQFTDSVLITQENQGVVFIRNVSPVPTGQDVYIDYRSGGRWSRIVGNPDGSIGNNPAIGAGLVSDNGDGTATISVTLGANPDIGSTVIFSWGSDDFINDILDTANNDAEVYLQVELDNELVETSSVIIDYTDFDNTLRTVTFDNDGNFSLDGLTGSLDAVGGTITFTGNVRRLPNFSDNSDQTRVRYNYALPPEPGQTGEQLAINNPSFTTTGSVNQEHAFDIGTGVVREGLSITFRGFTSDANGAFAGGRQFVTLIADTDGVLRVNGTGAQYGTVNINGEIRLSFPTITYRKSTVRIGALNRAYTTYEDATKPIWRIDEFTQVQYQTSGIPGAQYDNAYDETFTSSEIFDYFIRTLPGIIGAVNFNVFNDDLTTRQGNVFVAVTNEQIGTIDLTSGLIQIDTQFIVNGSATPEFTSIYTDNTGGNQALRRVAFRTSATDLTTSSLLVRYSTTTGTYLATSDGNGVITGTDIDSANSSVDTTTGAVVITFTEDFNPTTLRYDAVAETTLPLDPELLGLNPVRLPPNGRVPVFDAGRHIVIFEENTTDITGTPTAGQTVTLDRSGQAYIEVIDVDGQRLDYAQFTADREAGTVTFADPLNLVDRAGEALTGPYSIVDRVEDMALVTNAEITGRLGLSAPLTRDYPAETTRVASALVWGDVGARVFNLFSQQSFDVWSDERTTDAITAQFDNVNFPIQINNADSFSGRWAAIFVSTSSVNILEETLGVVLSNAPISSDIAPINPATGQPYFTIPSGGWGGGWVTSNVLRFNTESGSENMWIIRTVKSGALTEQTDSIDIEIRGDAN